MGTDAGPSARRIIDAYFVSEFYFVDVHDLMEQFGVPYEEYRDLSYYRANKHFFLAVLKFVLRFFFSLDNFTCHATR